MLQKSYWKLTPQGNYPSLWPKLSGGCALYALAPQGCSVPHTGS